MDFVGTKIGFRVLDDGDAFCHFPGIREIPDLEEVAEQVRECFSLCCGEGFSHSV